jgi:hypothetical protein
MCCFLSVSLSAGGLQAHESHSRWLWCPWIGYRETFTTQESMGSSQEDGTRRLWQGWLYAKMVHPRLLSTRCHSKHLLQQADLHVVIAIEYVARFVLQ